MKKMVIALIAATMLNGGNISNFETLNTYETQEVMSETSDDDADVDSVELQAADENDLIGYWVDSLTSETPEVIEIYKKDGMLCYRHYQILYRKRLGTILRDEYKIYEYTKGYLWYYPESETVSCAKFNVPIINFYYFSDIPDVMIEKETETTFYRFDDLPNVYE